MSFAFYKQSYHNSIAILNFSYYLCLLQVEAGSNELVCLSSRKAHQVIIVSYAEIRDFLDKSFSHLVEESRRSMLEQQQMIQQQQEQLQQKPTRGGTSQAQQSQRRAENLAPDLSS